MTFLPKRYKIFYQTVLLLTFFIISFIFIKQLLPQAHSQVANSPFVTTNGTQLMLNGKPFYFTGVNAYELATLPGVTAGCGGTIPDINSFFSDLRPNSVVRLWAFQGAIATNINTKQLDWTRLDQLVQAATTYNQKLILALSPQSGSCDDGHWKDSSWYNGRFTKSYNDDGRGLAPLSFLDYAKAIANRYKSSPAIAMYELVSEPEASDCQSGFTGDSCYTHKACNETTATQALRYFYDTVGGQIKQIDPNHLIESGVMGNGQCGAVYNNYQFIHQSPGIDVASYHDYGSDSVPMPGDIYNGLQKRLDQMKAIGKPLIIGEVGMTAHNSLSGCTNLTDRASLMKAKMDAQFAGGIAGFLPWDYVVNDQHICTFDINPGDPLLTLLHDYALPNAPTVVTPTPTQSSPTPTSKLTPNVTPTPRLRQGHHKK